MALLNTSAIILRSIKYGEADRILHAFTLSHGRASFFLKNAARRANKLGAAIEPLSISTFGFVAKQSSDLASLRSAESETLFPAIRADLDKIAQASFWVDLLDQLSAPGQPDEELFGLARLSLEALDRSVEPLRWDLTVFFEYHLLRRAGYGIGFRTCMGCGSAADPQGPVSFSTARRAVMHCSACGSEASGGRIMSREIEVLDACDHGVLTPKQDCRPAERLLRTLIHNVLGRKLKSESLLDSLT